MKWVSSVAEPTKIVNVASVPQRSPFCYLGENLLFLGSLAPPDAGLRLLRS